MFNIKFKKKNETPEIVSKVTDHIIEQLKSPYVYKYKGSVKYIYEKEPAISGEKVAIFRKALLDTVTEVLGVRGYMQLRGDSNIMLNLLEKHGIEYPKDRLDGDVWFIEDDQDAYFFTEGMKGAKRI